MYSRGGNSYGQQQQPYGSQSTYSQALGAAYPGGSAGAPDGGTQLSMGTRQAILAQESDMAGYRGHASSGSQYGGQYSSLYGSSAGQQVPGLSAKGVGQSALDGRNAYDSPKFTSGDYVSQSSCGYGHKGEQLYPDKISDYPSIDRQSAYAGTNSQNLSTGRYADSLGFSHQHQVDVYDRMDQASLLRKEQLLKAQALQSASLDGSSRQADYLAAMGASARHPAQDLMSYGGKMDADPRSLALLSGSSYDGQHAPSILGAAPRRSTDELMFAQGSSNPGYGVSLPPGRDYATGKGLHGASLDSDYPGSLLSRGAHSRIDERKDDRSGFAREIELREEERRRDLLREREKDREREKERERERERDRERERRRERERLRERLERREKERDRERERERAPEVRRDRTPPRISKDRAERGGSSATKDTRPSRRDSPRHEAVHRRHSPVKEKRREYICKIYASRLVDIQRDYLSLDKRYPRLFVSPECAKVVVNWPRENLKLPIYTPVSFEHDFVEEDAGAGLKELSAVCSTDLQVKSESQPTVWNAKMILMSGLSQNALEELSSDKTYDDRIPHFCNMLRFAILKKDNSFMAIGGPWDSVDGGDPAVDPSSLVQTVTRYAKGVAQLDLKNCTKWNRFLEIHYDRVGKDGFFSHREVTVLYVPDLAECLPSLEAWRDKWLAHKKFVAERERLLALKKEKSREKSKEKSREKKGDLKDKETSPSKDKKMEKKTDPKREVDAAIKEGGEGKNPSEKIDVKKEKIDVKKEKIDVKKGEESNNVENSDLTETTSVQTAVSEKPTKKKVVRKVVKQKVVAKKNGPEDQAKQSEKMEEKNGGEIVAPVDVTGQQVDPSANTPVKTFKRKKVVKKVSAAKTVKKEAEGLHSEAEASKELKLSEDKVEGKSELSTVAPVVAEGPTKTTTKKKIIKRVVAKKKAAVKVGNDEAVDNKTDGGDLKGEAQAAAGGKIIGDPAVDAENQVDDPEKKPPSKSVVSDQPGGGNSGNNGSRTSKDEKNVGSASKITDETHKQGTPLKDDKRGKSEKSKETEKSKDEKKDKEAKDESRSKSNKDTKEKKQAEELPRRPGLFLRTKKESKLRSLSLSLDSLLDYSDKDLEESTFELSIFAESLHEMLQYEMGSRLLTFLQKLRIKFVTKRNQRKRQREEVSKESDKKSSTKRVKTEDVKVEDKPTEPTEKQDGASHDDNKKDVKEEKPSVDDVENVKPDDETDDEDPEEDPEEEEEEDEEMPDADVKQEPLNVENSVKGKTDAAAETKSGKDITEKGKSKVDAKPENEAGNSKDNEKADPKGNSEKKQKSKETVEKMDKKKREAQAPVNKELLQAFRFFDRNRAGYIRVEDMRLIIHNLGKFLSHRDVKELVQSALLESNTGRDDHILYNKLVRMPDL